VRYNEVIDSFTGFKWNFAAIWIYANYDKNPLAEFGRIWVWWCWTYIWTNTTSLVSFSICWFICPAYNYLLGAVVLSLVS